VRAGKIWKQSSDSPNTPQILADKPFRVKKRVSAHDPNRYQPFAEVVFFRRRTCLGQN
jgi:hypothetical protein